MQASDALGICMYDVLHRTSKQVEESSLLCLLSLLAAAMLHLLLVFWWALCNNRKVYMVCVETQGLYRIYSEEIREVPCVILTEGCGIVTSQQQDLLLRVRSLREPVFRLSVSMQL